MDINELNKSLTSSSEQAQVTSWRQFRHDPTNRDIANPDWLFETNGVRWAPRKEMTAITGRAGKGKSFFSLQMFAAAAFGERVLGITPLRQARQVLYVDTEQSEYDVAFRLNAVFRAMGKQDFSSFPSNVEFLRLRSEPDNVKRYNITLEAITDLNPDVVFLDGITDFVRDFDDKNEANEKISYLLNLTDKINGNVFPIIHQNEGGDSPKLRELIGSEVMRKDRSIISVDVKDGRFKAESIKGVPVSYEWRLTQFGNLTTDLSTAEEACEDERQKIADVFHKVIEARKGSQFSSKKQIAGYVGTVMGCVSESTNKKLFERAVFLGVVTMAYDGHKYLLRVDEKYSPKGNAAMARGEQVHPP